MQSTYAVILLIDVEPEECPTWCRELPLSDIAMMFPAAALPRSRIAEQFQLPGHVAFLANVLFSEHPR